MDGDVIIVGGCELACAGGWWSGELALPSWADYIDGAGARVMVEIDRSSRPEDDDRPARAQLRGIEWLVANQAAARDAVLAAIVARLPEADLTKLELTSLCFHEVTRGRLPYIGFSFHCDWDREHGVGVMMHGRRAVDVGGADTAILDWIATRDARTTRRRRR
jgi:hypothetical protein